MDEARWQHFSALLLGSPFGLQLSFHLHFPIPRFGPQGTWRPVNVACDGELRTVGSHLLDVAVLAIAVHEPVSKLLKSSVSSQW